ARSHRPPVTGHPPLGGCRGAPGADIVREDRCPCPDAKGPRMSHAAPAPPRGSAPPAEPLLETENLVKIYGSGQSRFDALKGLTFQIHAGESVAVVGKSGSGKSTLMHLLALLDEPSSGVVAMNGRPVSNLRPKEVSSVRNSDFGFVFQQFFLNPNQT